MKLDIHVLVLPVGLLEAKNAQGTGQTGVFKRPMERKRVEPNGQRSNRSEHSEVNGFFPSDGGVQKVVF